jgi:hypothetical protein
MKKFMRAGNLQKAFTGEDGSLHLLVLASGPELDKQGERLSKSALGQLVKSAKAGELRFTPSHDTPIALGKSVDASMDDAGHVTIDFCMVKANPLAVQLHEEVAAGDWADRQVSIGGKCTKQVVYDPDLKKNIPEILSLQANHVALTFPDHAAYPGAALTEAVVKAFKAGDKEALKAAGISEDEIAKAYDTNGNWVPSTFAARWAAEKMEDELPEMLDCLRWNVETIMWVDDKTTRRTLLEQTFQEFTNTVLGEIGQVTKTALPPEGQYIVLSAEQVDLLMKALQPPQAPPAAPEQPVKKTEPLPEPPAPPTPAPSATPVEPAVVRKDMPDTEASTAAAVNVSDGGKAQEKTTKVEALKKAIDAEPDPMRRANLIQQMNALNAQ